MAGTVQDVTEQVQAEQALRAIVQGTAGATAENFFELLVEHLSLALDVRYVVVAQLVSWSSRAELRMETLGVWSRESLAENFNYEISEGPCQFITERREFHCPRDLQGKFPHNRRLVAMDAQSCVGVPLLGRDERVIGALLVFDDKTMTDIGVVMPIIRMFAVRAAAEIERMLTEQRVRGRERELAHAARLGTVGSLAAGLAHELNQPLCSIANYARSSIRRLAAGDEDREGLVDDLKRAADQAERAGQIIRKLKALVADRPPHKAVVDARQLLTSSADFIATEARQRKVKVVLDMPDQPLYINADEIQLEQVVLNLIQNALEAMTATPPENRLLIIGAHRRDKFVQVSVRDHGVGLRRDQAERIFESFFTTRKDGLGLGLSISRSIIEAHDGCVWASTESAPGTTLQFTIPAHPATAGD